MRSWLRSVMVWLVALALPLQALGGVTLRHCVPAPQAVHDAHRPAHLGQGPFDASADGAADHHAGTSTAGAPSQSFFSTSADVVAQHHCGACESHCNGVALLSAPPLVTEPDVAPATFASVLHAIAVVTPDVPERPPRLPL